MGKKIISIDLDGVLNEYNGIYDEAKIPPIKIGAKEFLEQLSMQYKIHIFTVRNSKIVKECLEENKIDHLIFDVSSQKNTFLSIILDDRAINFNGNYNDIYEKILSFQPYWKRKKHSNRT